jgi:UDP-glucuronate 4-epimerase
VPRILLTGVAGFIGSHLAERLLARGDVVVGIDNFDTFYGRDAKESNLAEIGRTGDLQFHELDIRDTTAVTGLLTPETVIVHLAAKAGVRPSIASPLAYFDTNVSGTASLIEAARDAGCTRFVFGSSSSVYGDDTPAPFREDAAAIRPVSPYAASKRSCELLLGSAAPLYGMRVASLRFFTVYGPRQRPDLAIHTFTRQLVAGEPITLFGDGTQGRDYTFCDDIVTGITSAIEWTAAAGVGVEHFNLGGDRVVYLRELVDEISDALGVSPQIRWRPMQAGDVQVTSADLSRSRDVLGYEPRIGIHEGVSRFVEWYRGRYQP